MIFSTKLFFPFFSFSIHFFFFFYFSSFSSSTSFVQGFFFVREHPPSFSWYQEMFGGNFLSLFAVSPMCHVRKKTCWAFLSTERSLADYFFPKFSSPFCFLVFSSSPPSSSSSSSPSSSSSFSSSSCFFLFLLQHQSPLGFSQCREKLGKFFFPKTSSSSLSTSSSSSSFSSSLFFMTT